MKTSTSKELISAPVFKLWTNHGPRVSNGTYAYIVMPAATVNNVQAAASAPKVEILSNTPELQAVWHRELRMLQAVFYKHGELSVQGQKLIVHNPAIIIARMEGNALRIDVADPTRNQDRISIDVGSHSVTAQLPTGEMAGQSTSILIN